MKKFKRETFSDVTDVTRLEFRARIDRMFGRLYDLSEYTPLVVRVFVDATAAAVSKYLPDGTTQPDKDYYFVKTDVSVNAVTIYPFGTQTIEGAASLALAAQYAKAHLVYDKGVWYVL